MSPLALPLNSLALWCPLGQCVWRGVAFPIERDDVQKALDENKLRKTPLGPNGHRRSHIHRIAWFVANPDWKPIEIDVGVPELGHTVPWIVEDGNHRLAAAFYRKDETILANVGGSLVAARRILGLDLVIRDNCFAIQ